MATDKLYSAIFSEDDIKWQSIIYELIRTKKIDPWDIDIENFSNEYMQTIRKLKELNFRVSGKVVLAAALLLKIKTRHLGLDDFIMLTNEDDEYEALDEEEFVDPDEQKILNLAKHIRHNTKKKYLIEPKTILPRQRKVTVIELMGALKKAIEVDKRRVVRRARVAKNIVSAIPDDKIFEAKRDMIRDRISSAHKMILELFGKRGVHVDFDDLLDNSEPVEKVGKFLPVLHLANHGKIAIHQDKPFEKMYLEVRDEKN